MVQFFVLLLYVLAVNVCLLGTRQTAMVAARTPRVPRAGGNIGSKKLSRSRSSNRHAGSSRISGSASSMPRLGSRSSAARHANDKASSRFQVRQAAPSHELPRLSPRQGNTRLSSQQQKSLVIIGASGGLGSQIARDAIARGRHKVYGVVRSTKKAQRVFELEELLNLFLFEGNLSAENRSYNVDLLEGIFKATKPDVVVEVGTSVLVFAVLPCSTFRVTSLLLFVVLVGSQQFPSTGRCQ